MKIWISVLLSGMMLIGGSAIVMAQNDEAAQPPAQQQQPNRGWNRGPQGGPMGSGMRGRQQADGPMRRMGPSAIAVFLTIDTDKDGELTVTEIDEGAVALKKLDTDKNGKLSFEELMKVMPEGMWRMGPPAGGANDQARPRDMRGQRRGQGRGMGPGQSPPPGQPVDQPADQPAAE